MYEDSIVVAGIDSRQTEPKTHLTTRWLSSSLCSWVQRIAKNFERLVFVLQLAEMLLCLTTAALVVAMILHELYRRRKSAQEEGLAVVCHLAKVVSTNSIDCGILMTDIHIRYDSSRNW